MRFVVFDYGGVLLHLNDPLAIFGLDGPLETHNVRWLHSPTVAAYESGHIDSQAFGSGVVAELGLPYDGDEFLRRFDRWPGGIADATKALVRHIPARYTCAILSNTNPLHWDKQDIDGDFGGRIDHQFLSFETGHVKPDDTAFLDVLAHYGCAAAEVLYIDDNPINVEVAADIGMHARHCPGVDRLAPILTREGVMPA